MTNIQYLVEEVLDKYPSLSSTETESGIVLKGILIMNAEYNDIPLYDEYELEINIPYEYPQKLPRIREISDLIPKEFGHFLSDGSFCLAAQCELLDFVNEKKSIVAYIDKYVMNYLYTASYYSRYGEVPCAERSHGLDGIIEAYMDRYECDNEEVLMLLLLILVKAERYRGHNLCPCGSGRKLRNCHGKKILQDIKSDLYEYYASDAYKILFYYLEKEGVITNGK